MGWLPLGFVTFGGFSTIATFFPTQAVLGIANPSVTIGVRAAVSVTLLVRRLVQRFVTVSEAVCVTVCVSVSVTVSVTV